MSIILRPMVSSDCSSEIERKWLKQDGVENYIINNDKDGDIGTARIFNDKPFSSASIIEVQESEKDEEIKIAIYSVLIKMLFNRNVSEIFINIPEFELNTFQLCRKLGFRVTEWKEQMIKVGMVWHGGFIMNINYRDWLERNG